MPKAAFYAFIYGAVQWVGFRAFAERSANRLGIQGYICNKTDGTVEVMAEGEKAALELFLKELRHGPSGAHVDDVVVSWQNPTGECKDFRIRH